MHRRPFVVGRLTRHSTTVVVLDAAPLPIVGPWTLAAVVTAR